MVKELASWLVTGDGLRKTRLHDYQGTRIDLAGIRFAPHCIWSRLWQKATGRRPRLPWLVYRAIARIASALRPDSRVLEFGSGASTLWLARRCFELVSIETDPAWYREVNQSLAREGITNVDCRLVPSETCEVVTDQDYSFDFALVDGVRRDDVAPVAISKVRRGGYIYLDNADVPEYQAAREVLLNSAQAPPEYFTDFAPSTLAVTTGMLVRF